jgi:signal transduction histidine kinase
MFIVMSPTFKSDKKNKNQIIEKSVVQKEQLSPGLLYNKALEELPLPVIITDTVDLSVIYTNKAACVFYGRNKKSFSKFSLMDIDSDLKNKKPPQAIKYYRRDHFRTHHKLKNNIINEVEVFNNIITIQNKQYFSLVIINPGKDKQYITEKERQLEEMKLRFLSTSSHEFRTPLTTILTSSEVLLMIGRSLSETRFEDYIIQIQNAVVYMTSLLDDILTLNKMEVGKWKFSPAKTDLYNFCFKMIEETKNTASQNHSFNILYEMKDRYAIVDNKLLHHIISNLLSNAVKYSPQGGDITLKVRNTKSEIEFIITDMGIGISDRDKKKLFETFYRGENIGKIEGTGLGLSIVKRCIDSHGGKITFKSKLNEGSTFIASIPVMTML